MWDSREDHPIFGVARQPGIERSQPGIAAYRQRESRSALHRHRLIEAECGLYRVVPAMGVTRA